MQVKIGETQKIPVTNQSIEGVNFNIFIAADAVNTSLNALTDFDSSQITVKVNLKRNGENLTIVNENLQILGYYSSRAYGYPQFYVGQILQAKGVAVKEQMLVSVYVPFGGIINVKDADQLLIEVTAGRSAFVTNANTANSFVEFDYVNGIGYEMGTPLIESQSVNNSQSSEKYSIGDTVTKLMFINLDKDNITENVITNATIDSKQLNQSMNFLTLLSFEVNKYTSPVYPNRFVTAAGAEAIPKYAYLPQIFTLFAGSKDTKPYLDSCTLSIQYNKANVTAAKNYIVYTKLRMTKELVSKAFERAEKHSIEKDNAIASA